MYLHSWTGRENREGGSAGEAGGCGLSQGIHGSCCTSWGWWLQFLHPPRVRDHPQPRAQGQTQPGHAPAPAPQVCAGVQPLACSRHDVNVIQKEKPEEKAGERQPHSSQCWRGGFAAVWEVQMLLAAGTEHTLLWLEQTADTKHSEGSPQQHLGRTATSRAGKQPLGGRSC